MISACLIVKNEEKYLHACLNSLQGRVNEIILVDTGSQDKTIEIAEKFGCKFYKFNWNDNFSDARNFAISKATNEIILSIDADELLISNLSINNYSADTGGYYVNISNISRDEQTGTIRKFNSRQVRLFRNHTKIKFSGSVHEQVLDSIKSAGFNIIESDIEIEHKGYDISSEELKSKMLRNLRLIENELTFDYKNIYYLFHKAKTLFALDRNDESLSCLREIIGISRNSETKKNSLNLISEIYFRYNNYDKAVEILKKSIEIDENQIFASYKLANILYFKKDYQSSLSYLLLLYNQIINGEICTDDFEISINEIVFKIIKIYLIVEDYQAAYKFAMKNDELILKDTEIAILYANCLFKMRRFYSANRILKNLTENQKGLKNSFIAESLSKTNNHLRRQKNILVTLCMIVKNEEHNLPYCLDSIRDFVDEIIITDTGSKDKTVDIAKSYNAKISYFEWIDDFSAARNESLKLANGEWILYLDADEILQKNDFTKLRKFLSNLDDSIGAINCTISSLVKRTDREAENQEGSYPRLFRNYIFPFIKFDGKVHEQVSNSLNKLNKSVINSDLVILHKGYFISEDNLNKKADRNISMLYKQLNEKPDDGYTQFQIAQTYLKLKELEKAKEFLYKAIENGGLASGLLASAYNTLGQLAGIDGDYVIALEYAEKSLSITKNQQIGNLIKAEALLKLKQNGQALETLNFLIDIIDNPPITTEIGIDIKYPKSKITNLINKIKD